MSIPIGMKRSEVVEALRGKRLHLILRTNKSKEENFLALACLVAPLNRINSRSSTPIIETVKSVSGTVS